jgi:molybdopterin-guanine dinucleotide biosynthesis protein A
MCIVKQDKAFLRMQDGSKSGKESEIPLFQYLVRHAFPPSSILDGGIIVSARDEAQLKRMKLSPFEHSKEHAIIDALPDDRETIGDIGPATGILTVHAKNPDRTLVILAVDFPQARAEALEELIKGHEASKDSPVTLFLHPEDGNPEVCLLHAFRRAV